MGSIFTANDLEDIDSMISGKDEEAEEVTGAEAEDKKEDSSTYVPPVPELTRADKTLEELLDLLDDPDFTPIIPDAVTDYYLSKSGLALGGSDEEVKIKRLLALATQKFVSDIATDAYEYSRIRSNTAVYNANNPQTRARALLMATMAKAKGTNNDANDDVNDDSQVNNGLNPNSANQSKEKVTLTMEDLSMALDEHGLNVNRPQFYR
ncbi:hypothetical protein CANINC_000638 [Pichia inconspicua]|uniref:Transcription initiation factor TFIID subunit 10 n=1 Tax=Pichia inconspicua TaxID=52247 RepID=A0A4T0X6T0_9ASCO|nr:hypothetical protein CANINC_000638 [[Candida] inconspicua]